MNMRLPRTSLLVFVAFVVCPGLILTLPAAAQDSVRGLVKPRQQATISSEITARVVSIPSRAGEAFEKGDLLVEFDCALYRAQLMAAEASRDARAREYENARELLSYEATSPLEVEIARSEAMQAQARYDIERLKVRGCRITAPFPGRVIQVMANAFESINTGEELLSVLSDEQLEIELIVPSAWLGWLRAGETFSFEVDETGTTHAASVARIGAMVDPVSQTVQVVGHFEDQDVKVLSGMSGSATFSREGS